jgi:hypothetical protein
LLKSVRGRLVPILAMVLLITSVSSSFAETWKGKELEEQYKKAAIKLGPLRIQPAIVLSNAGVDSNIYYDPTNPIRDFTLTAGPALNVYLPIYRKLIISAYGSPQYVYYVKTARERTWNYFFTGSAALNLKRVFLSLDWKYSDAREHWNTEIDIRPRCKEDDLIGSFLVQTSYRTSLAISYREVKYDYENIALDNFNVQEQLNRKERYVDLSAYYQATSRTKLFLDFEYGKYNFDFADTAALKDSQSRAAYAGVEFSPTGRIRGKIRVGYKEFDIDNPEGIDYRGLVWDSQVSVRVARPLVLRASYVRDVTFSLWYNNAYYLADTPGVGASVYLLKFLRLDYDFTLGRDRYPEEEPGSDGGPNIKRLDDFYTHSVGLYFRIWKKTAIGVIASHWQRISNLVAENNKQYFYGLNLTYDF